MRTALVSAVVALLFLTACGERPAKGTTKPETGPTITVQGRVKVETAGAFRHNKGTKDCVAVDKLGDVLAVGKSTVVIQDPKGNQAGLGEFTSGVYQRVKDTSNQTNVAKGICVFTFAAASVPKKSGLYTAEIPDLNVRTRFRLGDTPVITVAP